MRKSLALLAVSALVLLGACGASGGSDAETTTTVAPTTPDPGETTTTGPAATTEAPPPGQEGEYADALAAGLAEGSATDGNLVLTDEEAACVAPEWVATIGVDALVDAGVEPADLEDPSFNFTDLGLDEDQGATMIDAFDGCDVDIISQFRKTLTIGLDDAQASCLADELSDDLARSFLIETLIQPDLSADLNDALGAIDQTCQLSEASGPGEAPAGAEQPTTPSTVGN